MIKPIIQAPDTRLRRVAAALPEVHHETVVQDLLDTFMETRDCIGLAATQIGEPWRVIVVDVTPRRTETYLMVNPVITRASDDMQAVRDGCMSVRNGKWFQQTRRPKRIAVEWRDAETGLPRRQKFSGLIAAAVHHEVDHLEGILFTDRIAAAMAKDGVR